MEWKLKINPNKTTVIVFGTNKREIRNFNFTIAGNNIEIVDSYKYLGVYFSSNGSFFTKLVHSLYPKPGKLCICYIKVFTTYIDLQLKLFDHTISPIVSNGSELWSNENTDIIEKVHLEF